MHLFIFPFSNNDTFRLARTAMLGRIGLGLGQRQMLLGQLQKHELNTLFYVHCLFNVKMHFREYMTRNHVAITVNKGKQIFSS